MHNKGTDLHVQRLQTQSKVLTERDVPGEVVNKGKFQDWNSRKDFVQLYQGA